MALIEETDPIQRPGPPPAGVPLPAPKPKEE